ncbi:OLC1v1001150C1 [Oldenlandia corymbosa var. corymbosa]|uniref:OLC1v1001150C1 n=1 Tax=Oldenlandia corymbosa var. corymbosa TaxID=529605 RepID=A0AAV1D4N5_OLDCO|nr:OLC1v1001150C1 [Oldenlandia corymbosa var. corymbosa]
MSLVAGSYERFIWGFKLKSQKHSESFSLTPLFSFPSHLSPIKCAAVAGSAAVTGGSDDTIKIYDLSTYSEIGSLHHTSSITSLSFFTPTSSPISLPRNLIAAAEDGAVIIYDADPFVHLKTVKNVHKKGVNDISIHPSGRLALSVGRDECLAMVNLVRGRRSFCCRLGKEASIVRFSDGGDKFFMVVDDKISVHESEDAKIFCELDSKKRVLCAASGSNGILFTGGEDRSIIAWDTNSGKVAYSIEDAHSARVKGIVVLSESDGGAYKNSPCIVASASSDGVIRVWDVRMTYKSSPLSESETKSRLTCLAGSSLRFWGTMDAVDVLDYGLARVANVIIDHPMPLQWSVSPPQDYRKVSSSSMEETAEDHANNLVYLLLTSEKCTVSEAALKLMELRFEEFKGPKIRR